MSSFQLENFLIKRGIIWHIHTVATQPVGVPAAMGYTITIAGGERALLLGGVIGSDNYGAGRVINVLYRYGATKIAIYQLGTDTIDNQHLVLAPILTSITEVTMTVDVIGVPFMPYIMPGNSEIRVVGQSLANTETLTGNFFIATRIIPPTITAIGAGVTLTTDTILQV